MNWLHVILFNCGFGLLAGYITSLVFNNKGGLYSGGPEQEKKNQRKMILHVALASFISGIFWTCLAGATSAWIVAGLFFGITTTLLTFFFLYIGAKWHDFLEKSGTKKEDRRNAQLFRAFAKSLLWVEFVVVGGMTLIYGFIFLLTPGLGILWGYLSFLILR
jgi:hypothetical protein